jgi:hypothetical protein
VGFLPPTGRIPSFEGEHRDLFAGSVAGATNSPTLDTLNRLSQGFILGNSTIGAHDLIGFGVLLCVPASTT